MYRRTSPGPAKPSFRDERPTARVEPEDLDFEPVVSFPTGLNIDINDFYMLNTAAVVAALKIWTSSSRASVAYLTAHAKTYEPTTATYPKSMFNTQLSDRSTYGSSDSGMTIPTPEAATTKDAQFPSSADRRSTSAHEVRARAYRPRQLPVRSRFRQASAPTSMTPHPLSRNALCSFPFHGGPSVCGPGRCFPIQLILIFAAAASVSAETGEQYWLSFGAETRFFFTEHVCLAVETHELRRSAHRRQAIYDDGFTRSPSHRGRSGERILQPASAPSFYHLRELV